METEKRGTVLIVEDEAIVAEIYRLSLERAGYRALVAKDGVEGLELATSTRPDFIFLDLRMPRMGGLEVLTRLAADPEIRDIPVVILSNYDEPDVVRQALDAGAKEYLLKVGVVPAQLADVVSRWIASSIEGGSPSRPKEALVDETPTATSSPSVGSG